MTKGFYGANIKMSQMCDRLKKGSDILNINGVKSLEKKMFDKDISVVELAKRIGVDKSTVYRKLQNNGENFTVGEANKIVEVLELSKDEAISIFFSHTVA